MHLPLTVGMSCAILAPENGGRRHCCTIDKYLRVGGVGKYNSRRPGGGGAKAAALPTKQREVRGGTALETEKK